MKRRVAEELDAFGSALPSDSKRAETIFIRIANP